MIVTSKQMKQMETCAGSYGLSMERLMENAGCAAAAAIRRMLEVEGKFVTIFCGRGNNGGDGFVVARQLSRSGANVAVVLTDGHPVSAQAREMYDRLLPMEIPMVEYGSDMEYLTDRLAETDLLVDAIFGTGFHGVLSDRHKSVCRLINGVGVPVFALDIPSGVNADTGAADPDAVRAGCTVMFDSLKPAGVMPCAASFCGRVVTAEIGIPPDAREGVEELFTVVDDLFIAENLPVRQRNSHKGTYGRLLNLAGCQSYPGAAVLSTLAAMRTGAGYVVLASTGQVCRMAQHQLPETVMLELPADQTGGISAQALPLLLEHAEKASALLIGNGLGPAPDAEQVVIALLEQAHCPVILDADGINLVARNIDIWKRVQCPVILTPHPMELSRLTGLSIEQIIADPLAAGLSFAQEHGVTVVVKGAYTATAMASGQVWVNTTGNAGLAKAGTGDVLAGMIGALAAQGISLAHAAACGVYLHGRAGDLAAQKHSQYGMLARDVIDAVCNVFLELGR